MNADIMQAFAEPVRCRHPRGWVSWMTLKPARGMSSGWVDAEVYRLARDGTKLYGLGTYRIEEITFDGTILSLGGAEFRLF